MLLCTQFTALLNALRIKLQGLAFFQFLRFRKNGLLYANALVIRILAALCCNVDQFRSGYYFIILAKSNYNELVVCPLLKFLACYIVDGFCENCNIKVCLQREIDILNMNKFVMCDMCGCFLVDVIKSKDN